MAVLLLVLRLLVTLQPVEAELGRPLRGESHTIDKVHEVAEVLKALIVICLRLVPYGAVSPSIFHLHLFRLPWLMSGI